MNPYYIKRGYENHTRIISRKLKLRGEWYRITLDKFFEFFHGIILLDTYIRNDILQSIKCTLYWCTLIASISVIVLLKFTFHSQAFVFGKQ